MDTTRALLKSRLLLDRAVWRPGRRGPQLVPVCDLCGRLEPSHLHENIVTRADTMKNKALQHAILTSELNVHLLCARCNLELALSEPFHSWLISLNLYRYGLVATVEWLESLPFKTGPGQYLRQVRQVALDMNTNHYRDRWAIVNERLFERGITAVPYAYTEVTQWQSKLSPARP